MNVILRDKIKKALVERYGSFNTYLEQTYENKITGTFIDGDIEEKRVWATYNQVILELKYSLKNEMMVRELQYGLTDGSDPSKFCLTLIESLKHKSPEIERLYHKIMNLSFPI